MSAAIIGASFPPGATLGRDLHHPDIAMPHAHTRRRRTAALTLALAAVPAGAALPAPLAAQGATPAPTHVYRVNGSLADERGGPSLVALGGTVGPTSYTFGVGQGLTLTNALNPRVYSLELMFSFQTVSGQRQVVDLTDVQDSRGLRISDGRVNLNGTDVNAPVVFQANQPTHLVIARDANDVFTAYVNGVVARSFLDNVGAGVFTAPGRLAALFTNNPVWGPSSAGELYWARTYDVALTREQVLARLEAGDDAPPGDPLPPPNVVPEPGTWALLGTGLLALGGAARRRHAAA